MKRLLSLVVLVCVFIGTCSFSACSLKGKTCYDPDNFIADTSTTQIVKEKVTVKMFTMKSGLHGQWEDMYLFQELERRTNLHIEFEEVLMSNIAQMKGLKWEDKKNPTDAFFLGNQPAEIAQYSEIGALRALTGYDEYTGNEEKNLLELYAPNYMKWMKRYDGMRVATTQSDGNIYSFSSCNTLGGDVATQFINKKWIDKLNLASQGDKYVGESGLPETIDQFYETLKAFKKYDANGNGSPSDEVPFMASINDASLHFLSSAFGMVGTGGVEMDTRKEICNGKGEIVPNSNYNKLVYVPLTPEYREYMKFVNKLYKEGLIYDGLFESTQTDVTALGGQNRLGSFTSAGSHFTVGTKYCDDYVALPPLVSDINKTQLSYQYNYPFYTGMMIIPKATPYYREIIRWMDQLYDIDNEPLFKRGAKGIHWKESENGSSVYDPVRKKDMPCWELIIPEGMGEMEFLASLAYTVGMGSYPFVTVDRDNTTDPLSERMLADRAIPQKYAVPQMPQISYTFEEYNAMSEYTTSINMFMKNTYGKFITNELDPNNDKQWNEFITNLKKFKPDELLKIQAKAYKRCYVEEENK